MNSEKFSLDFQTIEEAAQAVPSQNRRDLLEQTRLSRLPKLPTRSKFEIPNFAAVCVNCKTKLDEYNQALKYARVCRKCISIFAAVEIELDTADKRNRRELLEKFAEVK